jgi:hypothetical protein
MLAKARHHLFELAPHQHHLDLSMLTRAQLKEVSLGSLAVEVSYGLPKCFDYTKLPNW